MMDMLIANEQCDINIPNKYGDTPLHFAVLSGSLDSVITLLNAGADVNALVYIILKYPKQYREVDSTLFIYSFLRIQKKKHLFIGLQ
jgi:ankyrin repeat protein